MQQMWRGVDVLTRYKEDGEVATEHDILYCDGPSPKTIKAEDAATLLKFGWFWVSEHECWAHHT